MSKDLSNYRKEYLKGVLLEDNLPENPIKLFSDWFINADSKIMKLNQMLCRFHL